MFFPLLHFDILCSSDRCFPYFYPHRLACVSRSPPVSKNKNNTDDPIRFSQLLTFWSTITRSGWEVLHRTDSLSMRITTANKRQKQKQKKGTVLPIPSLANVL